MLLREMPQHFRFNELSIPRMLWLTCMYMYDILYVYFVFSRDVYPYMYSFPPCRFRVYRADLSLLETVSRTLTSAQVKIKSEVAASNGQSKTISDHVSKLKRLVDQKVSLCSDLYHFLHNNYALSLPPTQLNTCT